MLFVSLFLLFLVNAAPMRNSESDLGSSSDQPPPDSNDHICIDIPSEIESSDQPPPASNEDVIDMPSASSPDDNASNDHICIDIPSEIDQCMIAFKAWKEMGGSEVDFPTSRKECCEKLGIKCDNEGNILELKWYSEGLYGNVTLKLGKVPQLEVL